MIWQETETGPAPRTRKYDEETRARAVRMCFDRVRDLNESKLTARQAVGAVLDVNLATLRNAKCARRWTPASVRA